MSDKQYSNPQSETHQQSDEGPIAVSSDLVFCATTPFESVGESSQTVSEDHDKNASQPENDREWEDIKVHW